MPNNKAASIKNVLKKKGKTNAAVVKKYLDVWKKHNEKFEKEIGLNFDMESYRKQEKTIRFLFNEFASNDKKDIDKITIKVAVLDNFYSTNLRKHVSFPVVAQKIASSNFDDRLRKIFNQEDAINLVADIAKITRKELANSIEPDPDKDNNILSFASKYCCLSQLYTLKKRKTDFSIYDSIVLDTLKEFGITVHGSSDKKKAYRNLMNSIEKFKEEYNLQNTLREIDQFLWLYGKIERINKRLFST